MINTAENVLTAVVSYQVNGTRLIQRTWEFIGKPWNSAIKYTGMENQHLDCLENMNPSCPECNMKKGCFNIEQFREELSLQTQRALRESKNMRFAVKYHQLELSPQPVIFYFEKLNIIENFLRNNHAKPNPNCKSN